MQVYREDLAIYPDNGWSLFGLSEALHRQGNFVEVNAVKPRFEQVWRYADIQTESSCPQFAKMWAPAGLLR